MDGLKDNFKHFLPYLEDLRRKLYFSTIFFLVVFVGGFLSSGFILKHFISFFNLDGVAIVTTSPFQFADIAIDIGLFCALVLTLPLCMYHVFSFASPALTRYERRGLIFSVPISVILFAIGFLYGFFILYYSFGLLAGLNSRLGIQNMWDIGTFLSQIFITASLLGLVFQFPLIATFLVRLQMISVDFLKQKRKVAVFLAFVLVSLLPPTDGLSLIAMGLPLIVMYEVTIFINRHTKNICLD